MPLVSEDSSQVPVLLEIHFLIFNFTQSVKEARISSVGREYEVAIQ